MPMDVFVLLDDLSENVADMESAIADCDPEEPLALGFCIRALRAAIFKIRALVRKYEMEEVDRDGDECE